MYIYMYVCRYIFLWITYKVIGMLIYIYDYPKMKYGKVELYVYKHEILN